MLATVLPPTIEPVSVAEAKQYMRVTHGHDDALIASLISAARSYIETLTGVALARATYRYSGDLPQLPRVPAQVVGVRYKPGGGEWADIDVDYDAERNLLNGLPDGRRQVTFVTTPDPFNETFRHAILILVQARYELGADDAAKLEDAVRLMVSPLRENLGV